VTRGGLGRISHDLPLALQLMEKKMKDDISRRRFTSRILTWAAGIPLIGGLVTATSPMLRVLRPTLGPFDFNKPPDAPPPIPSVTGKITDPELSYVWGSKGFVYSQLNVEYTPNHINSSTIPGFVVKLPTEIAKKYADYFRSGPPKDNPDAAKTAEAIEKYELSVFSRICVHLGCVFNYFGPKPHAGLTPAQIAQGPNDKNWKEFNDVVRQNYNYPGAKPDQGYFACPCHFSVYDLDAFDPAHDNKLGKVVSGPAPRPPRFFFFEVNDAGEIIAKGVESGGVA
jgi:Rieske Fe-S protein